MEFVKREETGEKVPSWGLENCDLWLWILQRVDDKLKQERREGERKNTKRGRQKGEIWEKEMKEKSIQIGEVK